ncbi:hypothetical protein PHLCEN_2v12843 [Hermanssonia centrifuga]|uniref:Uncharacterized protein n=1 Tax=Hermanssonia centrifuga TaxID=98765 RepID=A0A2R6NG88_9APHY|nr:hypothetical protein PHLCEN_2v12843 [Hermanssonia centrifuga]
MRSPVIAFGIFAAAAVSPSLVSAAPTSPNVPNVGDGVMGAPLNPLLTRVHAPTAGSVARRSQDHSGIPVPENAQALDSSQKKSKHHHSKRAYDAGTGGGNAYTGGSSDASGGTVVNETDNGDEELTNDTANTAGGAGDSETGDARGGRGRGRGPGGNGYTGEAGRAQGGSVVNEGGAVDNTAASNIGGDGAASESGNAFGGDAVKKRAMNVEGRTTDVKERAIGVKKRATDDRTGGGNAYTGNSGDTGSGNIINSADDESTITNTGPGTNTVPVSGTSTTGDAEGGRGDGKGPGGNAYSGFAGPTRGGEVVNSGGPIDNTGATNVGGDGADSVSGDAEGGSA